MYQLNIVNVVATANLRQQVDLLMISELPDTTYDQKIYGGRVAYLKTPEMYGKVTIFPSGKLISVGTKSPEQAQQDLERTVKTLVTGGLTNPVEVGAELRNIIAVQHLEKPVDLGSLSIFTYGIYEPEQFPGLILRQENPKVTYLIFSSGKVVIAGSKSLDELELATKHLHKRISIYFVFSQQVRSAQK